MIFLAITLLFIALFFYGLQRRQPAKVKDDYSENVNLKLVFSVITIIIGFTSAVLFVISSITIVPAGHSGVLTVFGKTQDLPLTEGLHPKNPFAKKHNMNIRTQTYTMSDVHSEGQVVGKDALEIIMKDDLTMTIEVSVPFNLIHSASPWVYRNLGTSYVETIIRPEIRSTLRDVFSQYTSQELYSLKREEAKVVAQKKLQESIDEILKKKGFTGNIAIEISSVLIRDIQLPPVVKNAIEEKIAEQQRNEKMQYTLLREEKEAERKRIEAAGIRDFQRIVSEGISEPLLRWKGIEATIELSKSPNSKVVVIGSGDDGMPLILGSDK